MTLVSKSRAQPNLFARQLFDGLAGRYDALAEVLSFGQNRRWRAAMVAAVAAMQPPAASVLDVASGTAGVALLLADTTPTAVVGVDLTEQMLHVGRRRVAKRGLESRIRLVAGRAEALPFSDAAFDALTVTYLLRYVRDPAATLAELARVVRPGGVMASLEFAVPTRRFYRAFWTGYTRAVLPVAGLVTGGPEWFRVGRFLGPSITEHYRRYPLDWTVGAWEAAGFRDVTVRPMSFGAGLVMWGRKGK
jgi:demethylmenaquinone methyltransferase/2-methoxy-6-polyprenyl-1,4-benzoquinol methylase